MNLDGMTDDELAALSRAAMHELMVRGEVARINGTAPCPTIWGPGPPWYCIPKCKTGPAGHEGRCEPNMTQDEAGSEWGRSVNDFIGSFAATRAEAERRVEAL